MVRIITYFIVIIALVGSSVWIADRPGMVILEWQGWRLDTTVPILLSFLLFAATMLALVLRLLGSLHALPNRVTRRWSANRRRKGYHALKAGFAAVAAGDSSRATEMAKEAGWRLTDSNTSLLLQAQAAELARDETAVHRYYNLLRASPTTELIGLKGLITAAYRAGDHGQVLDLARRAVAIQPVDWAVQTLFDALVRERLWEEATRILVSHQTNAFQPPDKANRYQVVLDTQRALESDIAGQSSDALRLARRALGRDASMVPAAILAARLYAAAGRVRKAARLVEAAWCRTLHPGLVGIYFDIWPSDDALKRLQRAERLVTVTGNPDHLENRLLIAGAALEAQFWDQVHEQLTPLLTAEALSQRVAVLMARLEQLERNDAATADNWLQRASTAPADAEWHCRMCGTDATQWDACCPHCGRFDSLAWIIRPVLALAQTPALTTEKCIHSALLLKEHDLL
ncbi:Uncharacterized protein EC-HemY, likely associated with heme metabolism based on gene clustering with hemC, hemD in Proteobacteria (unrelated to HemY-type PPO in GramPositives) [invertebrate metagenome]|uniref:Uncharacterized protein EC-HemY, likely associated with heme metabolism based on gene clustering with hemC, hemD in Proteobacteria (Unrelated to HemY-type PPO in GramPositives) n=1 Tax=invertebrate metagenome TaxID=1711999 RepID=A0A484H9E5_9ZZZZ